jgi:nitrite reductase (NADH) small subunit
MAIHYVAKVEDFAGGECIIVDINGLSIGVYQLGKKFYALYNRCPHEGAPLCKGPITGTNLPSKVYEYEYSQGEIVRCPWHGWEFDIKTGKSLFNDKVRTRSYRIEINEGRVGIII